MGAGILKTKTSKLGDPVEPVDNEYYENDQARERRAREKEELALSRDPSAQTPALERLRVAKEAAAAAAKEKELEPLRKGIMDEIDFLGKRFGINSKIGGRGLF